MEKRSSALGVSTAISFCATRKIGCPVAMASSSALMDASRPTSKWSSILGKMVNPRSASAGITTGLLVLVIRITSL